LISGPAYHREREIKGERISASARIGHHGKKKDKRKPLGRRAAQGGGDLQGGEVNLPGYTMKLKNAYGKSRLPALETQREMSRRRG